MLERRASVNSLFCGHNILFLSEANGPKFMTLTFVIIPIHVIALTLGPRLFSLENLLIFLEDVYIILQANVNMRGDHKLR